MFRGTWHKPEKDVAVIGGGIGITNPAPEKTRVPVEVPHLLSRVPLAVDGMPPHLFRSGGIPSVALVLGVRGPDQQQRLGASLCDQRDVALPMHFGPSPQSSDFRRPVRHAVQSTRRSPGHDTLDSPRPPTER